MMVVGGLLYANNSFNPRQESYRVPLDKWSILNTWHIGIETLILIIILNVLITKQHNNTLDIE